MSPSFTHNALKVCVAQICQGIGFQGAYNIPLEVLTDILCRYINEVAVLTHRYTEHYERTDPNLDDLGLAFKEMGISMSELEEYISSVEAVPFTTDIPKFPIPRTSALNFLKPGCREIVSRPIHVHEHLPPMYPEKEEAEVKPFEENGQEGEPQIDVTKPMSPVCSPTSQKRLLEQPIFPAKKPRYNQEEEGQPTREVDSVMMTTGGFISSAREGKLPESKIPNIPMLIPRANSPKPPGLAIARRKMAVEKIIRQKNSNNDEKREKLKPKLPPGSRPGSSTLPKSPAGTPKMKRPKTELPDHIKSQMMANLAKRPQNLTMVNAAAIKTESSPNKDAEPRVNKKKPPVSPPKLKIPNIKESKTPKVEPAEKVKSTKDEKKKSRKDKEPDGTPKVKKERPKKDKVKDKIKKEKTAKKEKGTPKKEKPKKDKEQAKKDKEQSKKEKEQQKKDKEQLKKEREQHKKEKEALKREKEQKKKEKEAMREMMKKEKERKKKEEGNKKKRDWDDLDKLEQREKTLLKALAENAAVTITPHYTPERKPKPKKEDVSPMREDVSIMDDLSLPSSPGSPTPSLREDLKSPTPERSMAPDPMPPFMSPESMFMPSQSTAPNFIPPFRPSNPPIPDGPPLTPTHDASRFRLMTPLDLEQEGAFRDDDQVGPSLDPPKTPTIPSPLAPPPKEREHKEKQKKEHKKEKKEKEKEKKKEDKEKTKRKKDKKAKAKEKAEKKKEKEKAKLEKKIKQKKKQVLASPKLTVKIVGEQSTSSPPPSQPPESVKTPKLTIKPIQKPVEPEIKKEPSPPPVLDQPGSPEIAKFSALITRPKPEVEARPKGSGQTPSVPSISISKDGGSSLKIKNAGGSSKKDKKRKIAEVSSDASSSFSGASPEAKKSKPTPAPSISVPGVLAPSQPSSKSTATTGLLSETVGPVGHFVDDQGNEVWICPSCGKQDDGSPMIGCDTCDDWYHWVCVGILVPPNAQDNWYCPRCLSQHKQRGIGATEKKKRGRRRKYPVP